MLIALASLALAAPSVEEAEAAWAARDWAAAEKAYGKLARGSDDGNLHYRHAWAAHQLGHYDVAAKGWAKAVEHGAPGAAAEYNLACALAHLGRVDDAFAALERAVAAGFTSVGTLDSDTELDPLREDPRFAALRTAIDVASRPCMHDPRFRAFDFWVGDWTVFDRSGQRVGQNRITLLDGGCTVLEQWTSALGPTGTSLNRFDPAKGAWVQDWMSQRGWTVHYEGDVEDGAMRFTGTRATLDGTQTPVRATFTPEDGTVIQHLEAWDAASDAWTTTFYGVYRKAE